MGRNAGFCPALAQDRSCGCLPPQALRGGVEAWGGVLALSSCGKKHVVRLRTLSRPPGVQVTAGVPPWLAGAAPYRERAATPPTFSGIPLSGSLHPADHCRHRVTKQKTKFRQRKPMTMGVLLPPSHHYSLSHVLPLTVFGIKSNWHDGYGGLCQKGVKNARRKASGRYGHEARERRLLFLSPFAYTRFFFYHQVPTDIQ